MVVLEIVVGFVIAGLAVVTVFLGLVGVLGVFGAVRLDRCDHCDHLRLHYAFDGSWACGHCRREHLWHPVAQWHATHGALARRHRPVT